jgi:carbon-monoxide dehydrogenase large subunit
VDYMIPGAPELPNYTLDRTVTPSPSNPLGVKGVGEAGTIGAPPAVINAIIDALSPFGVKHIDMPALPMRVWNAIQDAQGNGAASGEYDAALGSREADVRQEGRSSQ